jgi:hypothetical protein
VEGRVVKVSDEIPSLRPFVHLAEGGKFYEEFHDKAHPGGQYIENKDQKRRVMKELGIAEL